MFSVPISQTNLENRYQKGWETAQKAAGILQEKDQIEKTEIKLRNPEFKIRNSVGPWVKP
jgi:hypothetical protein